jgi:Reverse transcriptase (RNA-dependent DNA polymerase)
MTILIVLIVMVVAGWHGSLMDIHGAFLKGNFVDDEKLDMHVPQGFEQYYGHSVYLFLLKTIYGLIQSAFAFWQIILVAFKTMGYEQSKADPCLYYKWSAKFGLQIWMSWIDNCCGVLSKEGVAEAKQALSDYFKGECNDSGKLNEYCKIEHHNQEEGWLCIKQPVLIQSFTDEFDLPEGKAPVTPAEPGSKLMAAETVVFKKKHTYFHSSAGKLLHLMKWSHPEILNLV